MSNHIKLFNTHSDYEAFVESENYIEPHVSMCSTEEHINYNQPQKVWEMVDLGLPSGLLWANRNVGATSEEDYGLYFQWGDTVGYTGDDAAAHSDWPTTPFNSGNESYDEASINQAIAEGKIDATSGILKPQYDAATVHMGSQYHMPTYGDLMELREETNQEVVEINGVKGMKFINKSDASKYIFIPFAGVFYEGWFDGEDRYGDVWSSSLVVDDISRAAALRCYDNSNAYVNAGNRYYAVCVRGVLGTSDPTPYSRGPQ